MQNYQAVSSALMMRFAKRQSDGPRCSRCGQWFHLSFSGGRLVDQTCGCSVLHGIGPTGSKQFIDERHAKPRVAANVAGLDG
jgi:hypothetical protein